MKIKIFVITILILILSVSKSYSYFNIDKVNEFAFAQEIDNCEILDNFLITQMDHGIEIYEIIENGNLNLISRFTYPAISDFVLMDQFLFLVSDASPLDNFPDKILKIDISNKTNPILCNTVSLSDNFDFLRLYINNNNLLLRQQVEMGNFIYRLYNPESLEEITFHQDQAFIFPINNSYSYENIGNILSIYNFSEPVNWQPIGNVDLSYYHNSSETIFEVQTINDTIAVCASENIFSFWDINSSTDWEFLSIINFDSALYNYSFEIDNNRVIIPNQNSINIISIDDIYNPQLINSLSNLLIFDMPQKGVVYESYYYLTTHNHGIQIFLIEDNEISFLETYLENPTNLDSRIYQNYLFNWSLLFGIDVYDISNPTVPEKIITLFENNSIYAFDIMDNKMLIRTDTENQIYDITNPSSIELISTNDDTYYTHPFFDETDTNSLYIWDIFQDKLRKYDTTQSSENILLFEMNLPGSINNVRIHNNHIYLFKNYGENVYLSIYEINANNEINLLSDFSFLCQTPSPRIYIDNNFLTLSQSSSYSGFGEDHTYIYSLDNPSEPVLAYELSKPGKPYFNDNLIFICSGHTSYVYDRSISSTTQLDYISFFNDYSLINSVIFINNDNSNYLYLSQRTAIGVFNFDYIADNTENEIEPITTELTNYPNPFNPTTQISFSLPNDTVEASIEIYNIKGQKIKSIECDNLSSGKHNVTWNGEDNNNQRVSSGVYFYKLVVNEKTVSSSKMMLIK